MRLVQRRDLSDRTGVARRAVEHAVHLGAGRGGACQSGERGCDDGAKGQAEFAMHCGHDSTHPRHHRRRCTDLGQQDVSAITDRHRLGVSSKGAGAQRDDTGGQRHSGSLESDERSPAVGGDPQFARDRGDVDVIPGEPEQFLHLHRVRRRRRCKPRHDSRRQHRSAAQNVLDVVGQRRGALLQPDRARERRRTTRIRRRQVDADRQARAQTQLGTLGDTHDIAAGAQRVEDAPLTDPLQMFGRTGAAQDRQPAQFVGFVAGRRVRQHVRLFVLDADHPAGAVGNRLGEPEQVGARVVVRVAAVAMVLEGVVDESVERLPTRLRLDGHDRRAERDGPPDRRVGGFLDEDGRGHAPGSGELLFQPAHRLRVGHAQQEEEVRGTGTDRQAQPHVVGVDQGHRAHRHIQAARRLDQRHHRAVQSQQQLAEPEARSRCRHQTLLCPIRL